MIEASDCREVVRNTLQGFVTLTFNPSSLVLKECSVQERPDGCRWVGLPSSRSSIRKDGIGGTQRQAKTLYTSIVEIKGKSQAQTFHKAARESVDKLLVRGVP